MRLLQLFSNTCHIIMILMMVKCSSKQEKSTLEIMAECQSKYENFRKNLVGRWEGQYESIDFIPDTIYEKEDTSMNFLFETSNSDTTLKSRVIYEMDTTFKSISMEFRFVGTDTGLVYIETPLEEKIFSISGYCSILEDRPFDVFIRDYKKLNSNTHSKGLIVISKVLSDTISTISNIDLELVSLMQNKIVFQFKNGYGNIELHKVNK